MHHNILERKSLVKYFFAGKIRDDHLIWEELKEQDNEALKCQEAA
jgi:hypothetical protein